MTFAYADPPYIGCAGKYEENREVNHRLLIEHLKGFHGWALSSHAPGLWELLPMLDPSEVRICSWVKPFASFKPNVRLAYTWEPVLLKTCLKADRNAPTIRDHVSANITLRRGLCGAKPEEFCFWLFDALGMTPDDEFVDIFPGSGAVGRAHEAWRILRSPNPIEQYGLFAQIAADRTEDVQGGGA